MRNTSPCSPTRQRDAGRAGRRQRTAGSTRAATSPAMPSNAVTFERVKPLRSAPAPAGSTATALMLMGAAMRSVQTAGALEAILALSVAYANERVAFERPIGKFQAVQQNLARLAGEVAAALAASGSAADTIAQADDVRRRGVPRSGVGENPLRRGRRRRRGDRASGVRRHRLHQRARAAPLHAAHAGLARRFRQRKLLGGRARQARRRSAAPTNSGRWWRRDEQRSLQFDPDPPAARMRGAARAKCARSSPRRSPPAPSIRTGPAMATRTSRDFSRRVGAKGWIGMTWPKKYGGHERSFLERYVVTEEFRVANAPVRLHFVADRQSGPILLKYAPEHIKTGHPAAHLPRRIVLRHRHERAGLRLRPVRRQDQGDQGRRRLARSTAPRSGPATRTSPTTCSACSAPRRRPRKTAATA